MGFGEDFHKPCPGQSQTICDLYIDLLRGIIEHQSHLIADYVRREQGARVTQEWINGVLQSGDREGRAWPPPPNVA